MQADRGEGSGDDLSADFSVLWEGLRRSEKRDEFYHNWLTLQCRMIPGAVSGLLVMGESEGAFVPVSKWPEGGRDVEILAGVLEQTLDRQCGLLTRLEGSPSHYALAYPVVMDKKLHGAVAVEVSAQSETGLKHAMEHLQWGVSWIELLHCREKGQRDDADLKRLKSAVTLFSEVLAEEGFESAAMAFVTRLATRLHCDRVSIGFIIGKRMQVRALSHSARFTDSMDLIRSIEKAMDEAVVQRREIAYPADHAGMVIVREHGELSQKHGAGNILTLPLYENNRYLGALTLERSVEKPFAEGEIQLCRSILALSGPVLEQKRIENRPLLLKIADASTTQLKRVAGPGYSGRKLAILMTVFLALFFSLKEGNYRISSDVILEGEIMRAVSAPFNGYVRESMFRAGDIVEKGDVLCRLDDRDLRLERLNWLSQRIQEKRRYQEALARHNRADVNIIKAKVEQMDAQLELAENKLERAVIRAPFDGVLVSGDLTRSLGSLVQQGDVLFEVTPLDSYRVILKVDESRIADVEPEQKGTLVLSALPSEQFDFRVEKITPISVAEEGLNFFRVEARLEKISDQLRPGMEGVGKIFVDRRKLFSIWTRSLVEKVSLWIWSWLP